MNSTDAYSPGETSSKEMKTQEVFMKVSATVQQNVLARTISCDEVAKKLLTSYDQENYPMNSKVRGIAYLININKVKGCKERLGSAVDERKMREVLLKLNFEVEVPKNTKANSILDKARREGKDHSGYDCFVLVIMTHGTEQGQLGALDGHFSSNILFDHFLSARCKTLVGKPKLFFVQACRGSKHDEGKIDQADAMRSPAGIMTFPSDADQLIMYSTAEGFVSWRNNVNGSYFIQELCKQLGANHKDDLVSILTVVSRKVAINAILTDAKGYDAYAKQMPIVVSSLTKDIYFTVT